MEIKKLKYLTVVFFFSVSCFSMVTIQKRGFLFSNVALSTLKTKDTIKPIVYIDSTSFDTQEKFDLNWNLYYPWGTDHNGTARMYAENVSIKKSGILEIDSEWNKGKEEGKSSKDPYLKIRFHSGAIHYKKHIKVTKALPYWEISGDFKAPTTPCTWPAFWITGAHSWPPEIDILEFKGSSTNWQNTVAGPSWDKTIWTIKKTKIEDAATVWHNYKLTLERIDDDDTQIKLFVDNNLKSIEIKDFTDEVFWLIINMQMEGASGMTTNTSAVRYTSQYFQAKNIYVAATPEK